MAKSDSGWKLMNAADDETTHKEILEDLLPSCLASTYKNCPDKMRADDPRQWSFYAWRRDVLTILRRLLQPGEKAVLIGHDIGVWLAILAAIRCPDLVHSVVCLSTNVDCFMRIFADELTAEQQGRIRLGEIAVVSHLYDPPVPLTLKLIEESKPYHLFSMKG
jgi:pimeloyl-ACP methyl ester carboxylesterase